MELRGGIFDMDGTLLDSMPMWFELGPNMLRSRGVQPGPDIRERMKPLTLRESAAYCKEAYGLTASIDELVDGAWAQVEAFYRSEVKPKPGVTAYLEFLKQQGVKMYVATATDRPLAEDALRRAGIRDYFQGVITCGEVGVGKEYPDVYEQALALLGTDKAGTVIFEDALHAVQTAKGAGFRVAGIYEASVEEDQAAIRALCDYYIRSYEDLLPPEGRRG